MSTITQSYPSEEVVAIASQKEREGIATGEGSELLTTYFEYVFYQTVFLPPPAETPSELTDEDLIEAAAQTGTFDFWNAPGEDIYSGPVNE
jgi:hypothetical protein